MMFQKFLVSTLLLGASLVTAGRGITPPSGCGCRAYAEKKPESSSWLDTEGKTNWIFDIIVENQGTCGAIDIGVDIVLPPQCEITSSWGLERTTETTLITGFDDYLGGGDWHRDSGFIVTCIPVVIPVVVLHIFDVNWEHGCTPGCPPPSPPPYHPPPPVPTCCAEYDSFLAIDFSARWGVSGVGYSHEGPHTALATGRLVCDVEEAEVRGMTPCGCHPVLLVENKCGAIAVSNKIEGAPPGHAYIFGTGDSKDLEAAKAEALFNCQCNLNKTIASYGPGSSQSRCNNQCSIQNYGCTTDVSAPGDGY